MGVLYLQNSFTRGVLDAKLKSRADYEGYYKGALTLENVIVSPQGGVFRRFGTIFQNDITSLASSINYLNMGNLDYDPFTKYVFILYPSWLNIYLAGTLQATIATPYSASIVSQVKFVQLDQQVVFTEKNITPRLLTRTSGNGYSIVGFNGANGTLQSSGFTASAGAIYPVNFSGSAVPTTFPLIDPNTTYFVKYLDTSNFQVFSSAEDAQFNAGAAFQVQSAGTSATATLLNTFSFNSITFINTPAFDFSQGAGYNTQNFSVSDKDGTAVQLNATGPIFGPQYVGGIYAGGGGTMRLVQYNSPTQMIGAVVSPFLDIAVSQGIRGVDSFLGEPAFSSTRGWPTTCSFFQGRLVFGGSASLPSHLFLSAISDYFNFDATSGNATDQITLSPPTSKSNFIQNVIATNAVVVLTTAAVCTTQLFGEDTITPANASYNEQVRGAISAVEPVVIDNQIVYFSAGGNIGRALIYDLQRNKFESQMISSLSSDIITGVLDMAVYENTDTPNGEILVAVNSDGTLATYQSLTQENIDAWSHSTTQGKFLRVSGINSYCWFLVQRVINGVTKIYLEQIDDDVTMDCCKTFSFSTPQSVVTGLSHLEGATVGVYADGWAYVATISNGQLTLSQPAVNVSIGLTFSPKVTPMPIAVQLQQGNNIYNTKHVRTIWVDFYNSSGISIEGCEVPTYGPYDDPNLAPPLKDMVFEYTPMGGWAPDKTYTVTQELPFPFYLRGMGFNVDVSSS